MKTEASMNTKPLSPADGLSDRTSRTPIGGDPKDFCACGHHEMNHAHYEGLPRACNQHKCDCREYRPESDDLSVAEKKAAVLARWPKPYVCSEVYEDAVFITLGPGRDLSAKFDTEDAAWCDAYDRMFKLPLTQEGAPECQASGQACHYESVGPNKSVQCVYCGNPVPASVPAASPEGERDTAFRDWAKETTDGSKLPPYDAIMVHGAWNAAWQASRASLPVGELPPKPTVTCKMLLNQPKYPAGRANIYMNALEANLLTTQAALAQAEERIAGPVKDNIDVREKLRDLVASKGYAESRVYQLEQGWRSVDTEMPPNNGLVLTWGNRHMEINGYYARTKLWTCPGAHRGITHWKPLDAPPSTLRQCPSCADNDHTACTKGDCGCDHPMH